MSGIADQLRALTGQVVCVHVGQSLKVVCYVRGALRISADRTEYVVIPDGMGAVVKFPPSAVSQIRLCGPGSRRVGVIAELYV